MKSALPLRLMEATRLTQAGRLVEATLAIQRVLRKEPMPEPVNDPAPGRVIDAEFFRVEEPRVETKHPQGCRAVHQRVLQERGGHAPIQALHPYRLCR